jgi:4-carboxymuconolactone decarboxylase
MNDLGTSTPLVDLVGRQSRFPLLPPHLDERQKEIYSRIAAGPRGGVRGPLALWLYSPDIAENAQALGEFLRYKSVFAPQLSEFIILIVARHLDCEYEWSAHAPIAEKVGVPVSVVQAIEAGREPELSDASYSALYKFVTQSLAHNRVDDAVFAEFRALFGERGVVEAATIVGYYSMAAFMLNAVQAPAIGRELSKRAK